MFMFSISFFLYGKAFEDTGPNLGLWEKLIDIFATLVSIHDSSYSIVSNCMRKSEL